MFDTDMSALSRLGRVVRYERRGRGAPELGNVAIDRIAELRGVIDRERGGRAVLVGSSFGGQLAVDFALAHGERVAALLLAGPGLTGHIESEERRARMARLAAAARHGHDELARAWLEDRHLASHGFPAVITRLVCDMLRDNAPLFLAPLRSVPVPPALPRLGRLEAPGRVYVGELDDADNHQIAQALTPRQRSSCTCFTPPGTFRCSSASAGCPTPWRRCSTNSTRVSDARTARRTPPRRQHRTTVPSRTSHKRNPHRPTLRAEQ
jgi:3-oxoadipate enol-lactonase